MDSFICAGIADSGVILGFRIKSKGVGPELSLNIHKYAAAHSHVEGVPRRVRFLKWVPRSVQGDESIKSVCYTRDGFEDQEQLSNI